MRPPVRLLFLGAFVVAAALSALAAAWGASVIESRSASEARAALETSGNGWAEVTTDGLQVIVSGTAPSESVRFRAIAAVGEVVDPSRIVDAMQVAASEGVAPPVYSAEILRNSDGISLIGLVPADTDREAIVAKLTEVAGQGNVADLLETADNPVPESWAPAIGFAVEALGLVRRAKVSVSAGAVEIIAVSDSAEQKARLESDLLRTAPKGLRVSLDISAPRPVITPFSLRFVIDEEGARFDGCSADNETARERILEAARAAGAAGTLNCTIGLGVPSPNWAEAVAMSIGALFEIGAGTVTFTDADVALVAAATTPEAAFDSAVGRLESNLPDVFSLKAVRAAPEAGAGAGAAPPEFTATVSPEGKVQLGGRISDERTRGAVENFAHALFGKADVTTAMRVDGALPAGWPIRVLAGLEALGEVDHGSLVVRADEIRIEGVSGSNQSSDAIARMLAKQLGGEAKIALSVKYDPKLDPLLSLPKPEDCERDLNAILAESKITFEPSKAVIAQGARDTLDRMAEVMKRCSDFPMEVAGHTDAQGREEMNLALSQDRAQAVIQALMDRRVLTGHLTAKGYGESVPIADNETESGREANRRIEFRLIRPEDIAAAEAGVTVLRPTADTPRPTPKPAVAAPDGVASTDASGDGAEAAD